MRIVLDTNIYIAAMVRNGFSADIINTITIVHNLTSITSEEILSELEQKLQNKFKWSQKDVSATLIVLRQITEVVEITEQVSVIARDPQDNKILECALAGKADLIVTLDQDLIKLKHFQGIGIIHPKTFSWTFPEYFKKIKGN